MSIFFTLFLKIIPLYLVIAAGYFAGKHYDVKKESIASLNIYVVAPAVVFLGTIKAGLQANILVLPLMFFSVATLLALLFFYIGRFFWKDGTRSLFAFSSSSGNTGYFGLPVCLAILGPEALPVVVMAMLGLILHENTVAYYLFARSNYTVRESLKKLLRLPSLYAFMAGIILNILAVKMPTVFFDTLELLKGAYAPLGMMIIGLGLVAATAKHIDYKFIGFSLFNKFVIWFLIGFGIIYLDKNYFHFFNPLIHGVILIESIVPLPANSVAYAAQFKAHPEKAAVAVMVSNFLAMIIIPLVVGVLL